MLMPTNARVLVRLVEVETQTKTGLWLPEPALEKSCEGTIVAIGPKVHYLGVGLHVVFGKYHGTDVEIDGQAHLILEEDDVLAFHKPQ